MQIALVAMVATACAGPIPSGSPNGTAEGSPSVSPSTPPPEPTPVPTEPVRTDVDVNTDVRDRPGVPKDFYDVYWWTSFGEAGQVGTTARIGLPDGERIITAGSGLVVSAIIEFDGDVGSLLRIRDIRTGALVREIETQLLLPAAVIVDRRLYWAAGLRGVGSGEPDVGNASDGGVWAVELDRDGPPMAIVESGTDLGSPLGGRAPFSVSPTGLTIASNVGGSHRAFAADIIDSTSATQRTRLPGEIVRALDDEIAIAWDEPPSDAPRGWVRGVEIDSGERLWRYPALDQREGFDNAVDVIRSVESGFLVQFHRDRGGALESVVAFFDPIDGNRDQVFVQPIDPLRPRYLHVVGALVSDRYAALSPIGSSTLEDLVIEPDATISILDLETGQVQADVFSLQSP
jgi:hypothetical protein